MSVQNEIDRISGNVADAYAAVEEKGGALPEEQTSGNLADAIRGIPAGSGPVLELRIDSPPLKTKYIEGESFNPDGLTVSGVFSNGYEISIDPADLTFAPAGPLADSASAVTVSLQWGVNSVSAAQPVEVRRKIYGVEWDGSKTTKLTRTDLAADFDDPVPAAGTSSTGSSPFDNRYPWSGMTRVSQDGNELVAIPKYWLKVSHAPFRVQITDRPREGYQVSPAHRDRGDGRGERDVVYIGRYECDSSYMSTSNKTPKYNTTRANFRSGIHDLGAEYWQADYALQLTLWYLYIVEFADWNGQSTIGKGVISGTSAALMITGATDSMIYHTGRTSSSNTRAAIQYRNVENPWGNIREWRDGIIFSGVNICTYNNPDDFSDVYGGTGGVTRSNKRCTAETGFISAWGYDSADPSFIYPSELNGSSTTYVPDLCSYLPDGESCLCSIGGSYATADEKAGPFCIFTKEKTGASSGFIGSRLQKLPNAEQPAE